MHMNIQFHPAACASHLPTNCPPSPLFQVSFWPTKDPHLATKDSSWPIEACWHSQNCLSYGQSPTDDDSEHARSFFLNQTDSCFLGSFVCPYKNYMESTQAKSNPRNSACQNSPDSSHRHRHPEISVAWTTKNWEIVNLDDFFVDYTQATLAHLGLRIWGPNLDDLPQSLYNKACRQAALKYFWLATAGGAYAYMNIRKKYTKDLELLRPMYNHYFRSLQKQLCEREKKQVGKFYARLKFALAQKLPKQYQRIISNVSAHSNGEYDSKKGLYVIKTLKFQSENTSKFFHRLVAAILVSDELEQKHGPLLDFYDPAWFNNLLTQQRIDVTDTGALINYWTNSSPNINSINFQNHMTSLMKLKTRRRRIHQTLRMIAAIEPDDKNYENLESPDDAMECADEDIEYNEDQGQQGYNAMMLDEDPEW
ncbi:hypothetical protein VP01_2568g3 [Puccinia sorghi]|uniref:Uncharacterized protein n=1 Tax=Puccinia sorghi TaxID=27349 RepID=A0A0L6V5Q0_9BASI|nr:hypothetical protein VP01_2568g3 [Puccinia sorghi]